MAYRDEREALRAQVDNLQQELEKAREAADNVVLFPRKTPQQQRARAAIAGGVIVAVAGAGAGAWEWSKRVADREINTAWGHLSACLVGEPLAEGELASARARRIQLAYVSEAAGALGRWPGRCQAPAHQLYQKLHDNGRATSGAEDAAYWAEAIAAKIEKGAPDTEVLAMLDPLWKQVAEGHLVAIGSATDTTPPPPARPLHLADLASAAVTTVEAPATAIHTEALPGPDRHVLIDAPRVDPTLLCTLAAKAEAMTCRPLPGELGHKHGLRLLGTADAGAAPLVFAGQDGAGGIFRSDTGELVASVRASSGYAAADGYVAIQSSPSLSGGSFEVIEQKQPHAEVTRTTVKPEAQRETQVVTTIHRSRLLWDKALIQMLDENHLGTSPWVAYKTVPREGAGGVYHRIGDLNWVNTTITGCRGSSGMVARFGESEAYLLFNAGDRWQGPMAASGLGELRCDGADAVFLSRWPVGVKRCTPAGCEDQSPPGGVWPTSPARGMSASDVLDGEVAAAWATDQLGVRFRVASAVQLGSTADVVVFDNYVGAHGEPTRTSVVSGIRLVAAGRSAVLFLATPEGIRAIRLGADGTFAPAKITP